ncbi:MAG: L-threonylcarbamoyladenylate synthase [Anaerolineae bacterium]
MTSYRVVPPNPECLRRVAAAAAAGALVVIPTDTVYGVAARPTADGAQRLFRAKGRPESRPLPLLLSGVSALPSLVSVWPEPARVLARLFWPGALTLVVPARADVATEVTAGSGTVGVRVPACDIARTVIDQAGGVLAVTSANRSGEAAAVSVEDAVAALGDSVTWFVDGGRLAGGVPSTVVEVSAHRVVVLRRGGVDSAALRQALDAAIDDVEFVDFSECGGG